MRGMMPRVARLLAASACGDDYRHLSLQIVKPQETDSQVQAGQFFMLSVPGIGEAAFTYLTRPDSEGRFEVLVRRVGELTKALFAAEPGQVLGYRGPYGQGWPHLFGQQDVLLVAGGCGLAPLVALIDDTLQTRPEVRLRLLYAARSPESRVLPQHRERWSARLELHETLDSAGENPFDALQQLLQARLPDQVLCCGPEVFMQETGDACMTAGVAGDSIWLSVERRMHCAVGLCGHCHIGSTFACTDGPSYRFDRYMQLIEGNGCLRSADSAER